MNTSRFAVGLVGLAIAGLWYFAGGTQSLPVSRAAETPRVTQPLTHENLTVYFVYGTDVMPDAKVMTLNEALERELAIVHETSDVNTLAVENKSPDYELFIQSGDIVKGGKQDRMAATDMLLPPKSGVVPLPAHCVEQGRWTGRGAEDSRRFSSSEKFAAGKDLKYANASGQQSAVWQNVSMNQTKLNENLKTTVNAAASPTSFQLTLEAPAVKASVAEYEAALKAAGTDRDDIIGVVFVVNGQVAGAEVYGSNALFRKAWPKLLNSAAVEAVAERTDKVAAAPPSAREIEYFLARAGEPEPAEANDGSAGGNITHPDTMLVARARTRLNLDAPLIIASGEFFQTEGRQPLQTEGRQPANDRQQPLFDPTPQPNRRANAANPAGRAGTGGTNDVIQEVADLLEPAPRPPAPRANPDGNRLNSNRNENRSSLMVESRDSGRQNAVIHRSYIKK